MKIDKKKLDSRLKDIDIFKNKLNDIIGFHLNNLEESLQLNEKKVLELHHVGKFLMLINQGFIIEEVRESPDFIISNSLKRVGLEHTILVNEDIRKKEGRVKGLFAKAQVMFSELYPDDVFLANIWLKDNSMKFRKSEMDRKISQIVKVIYHYLKYKYVLPNDIIKLISIKEEDELSFVPTMGAYVQEYISRKLLQKSIDKKEKNLPFYVSSSLLNKQWLLIVIGSNDQSSYIVKHRKNLFVKSRYSRVYLMEDFNSKLFRLK